MSVRKREWKTSKGKAQSCWVVDYTFQGKRHLKHFKKKKEADAWAAATKVEVGQGVHVVDSTSITVEEAAEEWISAVASGRKDRGPAEASTLRQCRYHVDRYIRPKLGRVKLSQLSKARVMQFRDDLLEAISRPLAKKVLTSLKGILSEAKDRGRVNVNVAAGMTVGNGGRHKGRFGLQRSPT